MRLALALVLSLSLALVAAGCGGGDDESSAGTTTQAATTSTRPSAPGCKQVAAPDPRGEGSEKPPTDALDPAKSYSITFQTNCGSFTVRLDQKTSPKTSASLVALARSGFYDDTIFHRIVPGFVIQAGDPTQTGGGGPGYSTVDKPPADAKYTYGTVAMAKTQAEAPGTAGSQFFVVTAPDAGLAADYAVVGTISKGLDVVDRIGNLGNAAEQPTQPVVIQKATVTES